VLGARTGSAEKEPGGTYQSKIRALMIKLIHLRGLKLEEQSIIQLFDLLTSECLSSSLESNLPPLSLICNDGTPLQFCISLSRDRSSAQELRYLTEVCMPGMLLPERTKLARSKIPAILESLGAEKYLHMISALLDTILPQERLLPDHPMLGIWFGARHRRGFPPALRLYCKLLWELGDPWVMCRQALDLVGIAGSLEEVRRSLGAHCRPTSIGFECSAFGFGRAKLYLRGYELTRSDVLGYVESIGYARFGQDYTRFHETFVGWKDAYIQRSVVLSLDLCKTPEERQGLKFEIGPHFYVKDDIGVRKCIKELACKFALNTVPYEQVLNLISENVLVPGSMNYHDVVGIGCDASEVPRLTIYLRPNLRGHSAT
jgi:hypothetical protein